MQLHLLYQSFMKNITLQFYKIFSLLRYIELFNNLIVPFNCYYIIST